MSTPEPASGGEARHSRSRILQALYDVGPLSRAELARTTGTSRSALTVLVQQLVDQGLLTEQTARPSSSVGGKPARPLWFAPGSPPIAAAHLLPGHIECALVSADGQVRDRAVRKFPLRRSDSAQIAADALVAGLREVLAAAQGPPLGVGVAVGGMVDADSGEIVSVALEPALDGMPVAQLVREELCVDLVCVDTHPRAQALGDRWFGQGRGRGRFASVYTGEALGVGLVVAGGLDRGPSGMGGEAGHSIVQWDGPPCHCGQRGCWETVAGHEWLQTEALQRGLPGARTLTAGPLARLVAAGVPQADGLLEQWAAHLSAGLVNLHQVLAPGLFILHGDVVAGGEELRGRIERQLHTRIPRHPAGPPEVARTTLDDDATLLGAVGLVLSEWLSAR